MKKFNFSEHGHVAYQIEGGDEWNRIQVKFSPYPQTVGSNVPKLGHSPYLVCRAYLQMRWDLLSCYQLCDLVFNIIFWLN